MPRPDYPLRQREAVPHIASCEAYSTPLSTGDLLRNTAVDLLRRRADTGIAEAAVIFQQYQACLDSFIARPGPSPDSDPQTANAATVLRALACQYHDDAMTHDEASAFVNTFSPLTVTLLGS